MTEDLKNKNFLIKFLLQYEKFEAPKKRMSEISDAAGEEDNNETISWRGVVERNEIVEWPIVNNNGYGTQRCRCRQ